MVRRNGAMVGLALTGMLLLASVASLAPVADASHVKRIVWPYGLDERWVPVIAGFKVVPDPLPCNDGSGAGNALFATSFENGAAPFVKKPSLTYDTSSTTNNLWHVTSFAGRGTDNGHAGAGKLYFGNDATGVFRSGFGRVAGAAEFTVDLPEGPTPWYISLNTKWETEWLEGYDHMWIEAQPQDGRVYILCTLNPEGRGDPSSSDSQSLGSCSPYRVGVCPTSARRVNNIVGNAVPGGVGVVDPGAPHWENRFVMIPPIWNGQTVKLRLTFDSADGVANTYLGWMVDDVQVTDAVIPVTNALPIVGNLS